MKSKRIASIILVAAVLLSGCNTNTDITTVTTEFTTTTTATATSETTTVQTTTTTTTEPEPVKFEFNPTFMFPLSCLIFPRITGTPSIIFVMHSGKEAIHSNVQARKLMNGQLTL